MAPAQCHARMAGSLEQVALTFVCRHEWPWLGKAGGESVNDLNYLERESGLPLWGGLLFIPQAAHPHANNNFIL